MKCRLILAAVSISLLGCPSGENSTSKTGPLVVYCAHDAIFSQAILDEFEQKIGIDVEVRMDSEATKSLGLVNLIVREANAPRCDVFWNNELLGTMELARRGLLEPYQGSGYERIPTRYRDQDGHWCGFAARLRVWIVNKNELAATPEAVSDAFRDRLKDFTYAKPMFGTTLTHYCALATELGIDELKRFDKMLRDEATTATSNGQTRDLVANGTCAFGWTDTDDYFGAVDAGKPVSMVPVRTENGETICIPNTVAIIKGTQRRDAAEQLVDFLLSKEIELKLASSESRQIPLGQFDITEVPEEVRQLVPYAEQGLDLRSTSSSREAVLAYLVEAYTN